MSIVLQSPASGNIKAIDDDPCLHDQFSAKEEAILVEKEEAISGEKKDATVDEEEEEEEEEEAFWRLAGKGEAVLVEKEEAIVGEKKDATVDEKEIGEDPCVGVGEEEKACSDDDDDEELRRLAAEWDEAILLAKEEAILGEKKDPTVDESDAELDEALRRLAAKWDAESLLEEEEAILGEKKDAIVDESDDEVDEALRRLAGEEGVLVILGGKNDATVDEEADLLPGMPNGGLCRICEDPVHMNCPWVRGMCSDTVPVVRPLFRVLCKRCGNTEFEKKYDSDDILSCTKCSCYTMCAVRKSCPWCLKSGHLSKEDEECDFFGKEWTVEEDPFFKHYFESLKSNKKKFRIRRAS